MSKENSAMVSQPKIDYINRLIGESLSEGDDTIELNAFITNEFSLELNSVISLRKRFPNKSIYVINLGL
jgi:hypothetical protein